MFAGLTVVMMLVVGCSSSDSATKPTSPPSNTSSTTPRPGTNTPASGGLVGKWSTRNVCRSELRAFRQAGLSDLAREWVAGAEYPGASATKVAADRDPCLGATPMIHSHTFDHDGSFASYDQNGRQVDDGKYVAVDDHTFTLGDPPVRVRYKIIGSKATFTVSPALCKSKSCREAYAHVISAFFPATYTKNELN
jgi:hypothetical protein